jgi:hypothetical protein
VLVPKIRAAARAAGVRDFQIFGEVFDDDSTVVSSFVRDRRPPNVLAPRRRSPPTAARGQELLRRVLLGYDVLYLLRGAPVVYDGDEAGPMGLGGDKP